LYVTLPDAYLGAKGETLVVRGQGSKELQIPILNLESVIVFGYKGVSPDAMQLCIERDVSLVFLTPNGQFKARVTGETKGNVHLRRTQYRWSDDPEKTLQMAQRFTYAKIANAKTSIQRTLRDYPARVDTEQLQSIVEHLDRHLREIRRTGDINELRGAEGIAARQYFSAISEQVLIHKDSFSFEKRVKRPPTDRVNALLSFLYTLLSNDVTHALESVGLDAQVGFLHRDRSGRNSLALDMMEEFRVYLADRTALTLINRQQLSPEDFIEKESGAVLLRDDARKTVLTEWQQRKRDEIRHPFLDEKITVGLLPYVQAMLLARYMRGDLDDYPPFFWK